MRNILTVKVDNKTKNTILFSGGNLKQIEIDFNNFPLVTVVVSQRIWDTEIGLNPLLVEFKKL
ncbi:MAG: hypothetical protein ACRCT1_17135 [Microcoleaceae cyanobacterium]|jgi:hypothetical protein